MRERMIHFSQMVRGVEEREKAKDEEMATKEEI